MKSFKFSTAFAIILFAGISGLAQVQPSLENGFKDYGSVHGSSIDSVNLTNGNWMLHSPLVPDIGQRGDLTAHYFISINSKNWQIKCIPNPATGQTCFWAQGRTGPVLESSNDVTVHRTIDMFGSGTGTVTYEGYGYTINTADGATHQMYGIPGTEDANGDATVYESLDTSGYHLTLTGLDSAGVWGGATVLDRRGNQYIGTFGAYLHCPRPHGNVLPNVGGHAPIIDDAPFGDRICSQTAAVSQITDGNGNVVSFRGPDAGIDTVGRVQPLENGAQITDYSQCVSRFAITAAYVSNYTGPGGSTQQIEECYAAVPFQTAYNATVYGGVSVIEAQNYSSNYDSVLGGYYSQQLVTLILTDGSKWTFDYDGYLEVTSVGLPTGGSISLTWTTINFANCNPPDPTYLSRAVASRTLNDNNGHSYTWNYSWGTPSSGTLVNTLTDPLGNDAVHTFTALSSEGSGNDCFFYETQTQDYQGTGGSRQLLKQVDTTYSSMLFDVVTTALSAVGNVVPTSIQTTAYPSGKVSLVTKSYDAGLGTGAPVFGNVTKEMDYDWGQGAPGPLLRETDTTYEWQVNSAYLTAHMLDLPASVIVKDLSGNRMAETDYTYDESAYLTPSGVTTQHGSAPASVRGNLTTVSKWLNTSTNPVVSHTNWYDTGEVYQAIDPLGNTTTHSYSSTFAGAYPTQTCNALSQCVSGNYDWGTGLLTSFSDANGKTSNYTYDFMSRLTLAQLPADSAGNQPQTSFTYSPANVFPLNLQRSHTITTSLSDVATNYYDGLGRAYRSQHTTPDGNSTVDMIYDGLGHVVSVTNPYYSTTDPTYGVIQTQFDALGRPTQVTKQDGSVSAVQYDQTSANSANGNCTIATDEAGKLRKSCVDGLGRLIEVDEPQASSGSMSSPYVTLYSYDALANMLSVNQKGDGSQPARVRNFTYDSLSRLLTATNPESGIISYSYDANSNLLQKTSPAPNQVGTATQTISYCYDALNRVTGKAYSAQSCPLSSPVVTYSYDAGTNGIGRLSSLADQVGSGSYSYDALGRIASESRTIAGIQKNLSYTYNLDSSVATLTYPSGAVITYTPDSAGRILSAIDSGNNINYVSGATYGSDNSLTGFSNGSSTGFAGISNSFSFNNRLQPVSMSATAPDCSGSGCTASVTINGSLRASPSGGDNPPLAAANTPLTSFVDSNGNNHAFYLSTNQHVWHLFWNGTAGWQNQDLTLLTGGPLAAAGSSMTSLADGNGAQRVYYMDANQHVHEMNCCIAGWRDNDMTAYLGASAAGSGSALASTGSAQGSAVHVYYQGSNQHLYHMSLSSSGIWSSQDVTAVTSTWSCSCSVVNAPGAGSALTAVVDSSGIIRIYFFDAHQHLNETYNTGSGWYNSDMTAFLSSSAAASGSPLVSTGAAQGATVHVYYQGANQHLYHMFLGWQLQDVTAATGTAAPAPGSAITSMVDGKGLIRTYFLDANHHVHETWCCTSSGASSDTDMTSYLNVSGAAVGSALTSFGLAAGNPVHVHYEGANQHIYHMYLSSSGGWTDQDLFPMATVTLADSGTVALTTGGFTATACFGPSTNTACNGQSGNTTAAQVASALAAALNVSGSPVTATASGATINLTWKGAGTATGIDPLSTTHDNPSLFSYPSFTSPVTGFSGGTGANLAVFSIGYDFHLGNGDNGNVYGITNYRDTSRNQSFTYDALNRLTSAQNAGTDCTQHTVNGLTEYWGNSYSYDAWGNLLQKNVTKCNAEHLSVSVLANNQLVGYSYDAAGNMTYDPTPPAKTYTFDQENRITGAAGYTYTYDADGNRVEKSNGTTGTIYWYMSPGIVAESDLSGNLKSEYVFFDGERIARKDYPGDSVFYYFSDHLKTASVITDSAGTIKEDEDFYPWGGELQFVNNDSNHYKFTSKERDSETGLDYFGARYYGNWLGRFLSPDWSSTPVPVPYADLGDPQSLSQYSYVRNIPTSKADPDGHCCDPTGPPLDFTVGLLNAWGSDNLAGAGRMEQTTVSGKFGQAIGDLGATVQGAVETLVGGAGEVGGIVLDSTGAGAIVGVPVNVVSAAAIVHGSTTTATAGSNFLKDVTGGNSGSSGEKPGEVYVTEPQASGKEYVGRTTQGTDQRMKTRTDGRTGKAKTVDTYKTKEEGRYKEQKAIDQQGGKGNLDNKRNEVAPDKMKKLDKKYGQQQ